MRSRKYSIFEQFPRSVNVVYNWDFSSSFQQARGLKSQRIFKNALCRKFFDLPEPQVSSITTKTGTEVENYDTGV